MSLRERLVRETRLQKVIDETLTRPRIVLELLIEVRLFETDTAVRIDSAAKIARGPSGMFADAVVIRFCPAVECGEQVGSNLS